jgi:hypothetical protein
MGRQPSCLCGACRLCKQRIYMRQYYQSKSPEERRRIFQAGRDRERIHRVDSLAYRMARDPEKVRARRILMQAKLRGKVTPQPCEVCGATKIEAHHDDYSKPFEVRWLCRVHHTAIHHPYLAQEAF